jgi:ribosomal protein S1
VDVRILKVDTKKRRISLSMKSLGKKSPRIKPSQGQLNTLAEHFKNR